MRDVKETPWTKTDLREALGFGELYLVEVDDERWAFTQYYAVNLGVAGGLRLPFGGMLGALSKIFKTTTSTFPASINIGGTTACPGRTVPNVAPMIERQRSAMKRRCDDSEHWQPLAIPGLTEQAFNVHGHAIFRDGDKDTAGAGFNSSYLDLFPTLGEHVSTGIVKAHGDSDNKGVVHLVNSHGSNLKPASIVWQPSNIARADVLLGFIVPIRLGMR